MPSLEQLLETGDLAAAQTLAELDPARAAALALRLGRPAWAAEWATDPLVRAAALLRLGQPDEVLGTLAHTPDSARAAVLRSRALWQRQLRSGAEQGAKEAATAARQQARREGDAGATIAAAALCGELLLHEPLAALRALAEGLKVAEMLGAEADPYLLAVLAHAQAGTGGQRKAAATAQKALSRAEVRSPARVVAYLALGERAQAKAEAKAGQISPLWSVPYSAHDDLQPS